MHDVIIVGGGPVGCYTASLLAEKGLDVLVLEMNSSIGHEVVCTGIIGVEAFDRFHLPRGSVVNRIQDVTFISPRGIRFFYRGDAPKAFMVDRRKFDNDMTGLALSYGAKVRCSSFARDLRIRKDAVIVEVESPEGGSDLQAKMAVVACGFNSKLTKRLGLEKPKKCLQGAEAELDVDGVREVEIYVGREIAPGSFAWVAPMNSGKARIGMITSENAASFLRTFLNNPMIRDRIKGHSPEINEAVIPIRPIKKSFAERVLVVGEAAGQVKSTTGGGIYYGLIGATLAAQTIEEAFLQGRFDESILKRYERRWRDELGQELEIGYRFRQIFSHIKDKQIDRLFEIINSDGIGPLIHSKAQFDWHKDLILALSSQAILQKYLRPISILAKPFIK